MRSTDLTNSVSSRTKGIVAGVGNSSGQLPGPPEPPEAGLSIESAPALTAYRPSLMSTASGGAPWSAFLRQIPFGLLRSAA